MIVRSLCPLVNVIMLSCLSPLARFSRQFHRVIAGTGIMGGDVEGAQGKKSHSAFGMRFFPDEAFLIPHTCVSQRRLYLSFFGVRLSFLLMLGKHCTIGFAAHILFRTECCFLPSRAVVSLFPLAKPNPVPHTRHVPKEGFGDYYVKSDRKYKVCLDGHKTFKCALYLRAD